MLLIIAKISSLFLVVGATTLFMALMNRAQVMKDEKRDKTMALEAIIALEPALNGKKAKDLTLVNNVLGKDNYLIEYDKGHVLELSPTSISALNAHLGRYRRVTLLVKVAVYIFASSLVTCVAAWLLYLGLG